MYLEESPQQIAAIRAALSAGSAEDLVRPAHTLRSSSQNLGGVGVAAPCRHQDLARPTGFERADARSIQIPFEGADEMSVGEIA